MRQIAVRVLMTAALVFLCNAGTMAADSFIDRPGNDFSNFDLAATDPAQCEKACAGNGSCAAWTYVVPGVQGPKARCWLKDRVPPPKDASCCTSGVRKTLAAPGIAVDMPGGDYSNFDLAADDAASIFNLSVEEVLTSMRPRHRCCG